jgi:UDP-N-acetylglucosamine 3-dehydrogenase
MSERLLRVGVAGCGQIARRLHIPSYVDCPRAKLVALYNHRLGTVTDLKEKFPQAKLYDDYERFLSESGVQAISICTPNALHAEMTIVALRRGIHVLVEKPMAVTLAEAQAMIEAGRESGALLMVGQTLRYAPCHRVARQIIQGGVLGCIFQIRATFGHAGPLQWSPRGQWFVTANLAGTGVIGDLGVHKADLLRYLTGQEVECVAAFKAAFELQEVEDNAVAVLKLSGGALATLSVSWTTRGGCINDFILIGERGSLRLGTEPDSPLVVYRASGERIAYPAPEGIQQVGGVLRLDEISEFIEAVLGHRPNPIPGEEGYRALEICIAVDRSARTGELVRLPLPVS